MITASIVVYHTAAHELLRVINCAVRSAIEILYIIDNSSNDSLRELKDVSEKIVYIHSENLGYGSGHNIGIRKAVEKGATYHAVLNPDIYWNDSVIEALSHFMDLNSDCGLVMPRILYPDGSNVYTKPACKDCFARFYCSGGCAANGYHAHKDIRSNYEIGCELQRKRVECAIMIKAALAED